MSERSGARAVPTSVASAAQAKQARRVGAGDLFAGLSVALILIPQSLAYAELAGMPPERGLYAAAIPLLAAAPLVSSPYLQTGPVAVTALLTFGVLSSQAQPGSDEYIGLGLLLALVVGLVRLAIGLARAGVIAYLMSRPMLMGFIPAATLLIAASQLPAALGANPPDDGLLERAAWTLSHPAEWEFVSVAVATGTLMAVFGGRRLHPLFPGVLVAAAAALLYSRLSGYDGPEVGAIGPGFPPLSLALPWAETPTVLVGGVVIALVGFAEAASISRQFATQERTNWDADREFVSQGAANIAAGMSGGFPVGGSFSRSSLNRLAGAHTRWSGAVTGLAVLAFIPAAGLLADLPSAVLGALVIAAVLPLFRILPVVRLWRVSRPQFLVAAGTFASTVALSPHVERGVLIGIALAIAVHLWRELHVEVKVWEEGSDLHVRPGGVLWFGAAQRLEDRALAALAAHADVRRLVLHLDRIGRLDVTSASVLRSVIEEARRSGLDTELVGIEARDRRLIDRVVEAEADPLAG
jgi:sulfate permease, SulP family